MMTDNKLTDKRIFTLDDIRGNFNTDTAMYNALHRGIDCKQIRKLTGGLYCAMDQYTWEIKVNRFEIATALCSTGYCAYRTALEYHGLAKEDPHTVQICAARPFRPITVDDVEYTSTNSIIDSGVIEITSDVPIRVTDLERTILDCLNRPGCAGTPKELCNALGKVDSASEGKLLCYMEEFNKKFLYKKVGFVFSYLKPAWLSPHFFEICHKNMAQRYDLFYNDAKYSYEYMKQGNRVANDDWGLYIPTDFVQMLKQARWSNKPKKNNDY